jgi:ABC-2 type transport system ATP-binding protein
VLQAQAAQGVAVVFSSHQLDLVEDLCDSVAIVSRGRVVASGTLSDLRESGPRRLEVGVDGAGADWARRLAGVRVAGANDGRVLLDLDPAADPQAVLAAARAAGPVSHFGFRRQRLSELFRAAVEA